MTRDPDAIPVVYLDTSVYGRPFDDLAIGANRRESKAVQAILESIGAGTTRLVSSFAIQEECARATPAVRDLEAAVRGHAAVQIAPTPAVTTLTGRLVAEAGLKPAEIQHIACAALAGAQVFLSCNPKRLRKQAAIEAVLGHPFAMQSPTDFVRLALKRA